MWRNISQESLFYLLSSPCPCYCSGQGILALLACPECGGVVGRCDEVEEMIRDVTKPSFNGEESICHPNEKCPFCEKALYGDFLAATETQLDGIGLKSSQYGLKTW